MLQWGSRRRFELISKICYNLRICSLFFCRCLDRDVEAGKKSIFFVWGWVEDWSGWFCSRNSWSCNTMAQYLSTFSLLPTSWEIKLTTQSVYSEVSSSGGTIFAYFIFSIVKFTCSVITYTGIKVLFFRLFVRDNEISLETLLLRLRGVNRAENRQWCFYKVLWGSNNIWNKKRKK